MSFLDEQKIRIHRRVPAAQAALVIMLYIGVLDGGRVAAITHGQFDSENTFENVGALLFVFGPNDFGIPRRNRGRLMFRHADPRALAPDCRPSAAIERTKDVFVVAAEGGPLLRLTSEHQRFTVVEHGDPCDPSQHFEPAMS